MGLVTPSIICSDGYLGGEWGQRGRRDGGGRRMPVYGGVCLSRQGGNRIDWRRVFWQGSEGDIERA